MKATRFPLLLVLLLAPAVQASTSLPGDRWLNPAPPRSASRPSLKYLRELLTALRIKTVSDPSRYTCDDFFSDHHKLFSLRKGSAIPDHFDRHFDPDPNRPSQAYSARLQELQEWLGIVSGLLVSFDSLDQPIELAAHPGSFAHLGALFRAIPASFTGTHAHEGLTRNFQSSFSSHQKRALLQLFSIGWFGKELEQLDANADYQREFVAWSQAPAVTLEPSTEVVADLAERDRLEQQLYSVFGSSELATECLAERFPRYRPFAQACSDDASWLNRSLRVHVADPRSRIADTDFDLGTGEGCKNVRNRVLERLYSGNAGYRDRGVLLERYRLVLHPGPGEQSLSWSEVDIKSLRSCLDRAPHAFHDKLPVLNVYRYQNSGLTLGWYWHTTRALALFDLNCHTILHELAHAWDFANKYGVDDGFQAEWESLSGFRRIDFVNAFPGQAPDRSIDHSADTRFVSSYAKLNPREDFAESLATTVLDPAEMERKAAEKAAFVRRRILRAQTR